MKTLLRVFVFAFALMLTVMPSVSAATLDGLDISITTDKEEYKKHDSIVVEHTIVNTNEAPVTNIVLQNTIPEGYEAKSDKEYTKKVDSLAPGESFHFSSTLKSTTPRSSNALTIILLSAGGLVVLGAGTSITLILLHNKKKKQAMQLLSLVLCVALVGGMTLPVMADSDPTTLNLTHEVLVDDQPMLLNSRLTYDPIYGEKANLIIDTADMVYDEGTQTYHLLSAMPDLTGTLLYTEGVKSATCFITDDNNKPLFSGTFTPQNMWAVKNIGLIVGINHVRVAVEYEDQMTYECTFKVNNVCEENMDNLNVDKGDTDNDGVLNFIEELKHTDLNKPDTDGDQLTDYDEIATLGTDPLKQDTDDNGVLDGDEDADGDGLTNYDEIHTHESNPVGVDTDADHLTDKEEVNTYHTDPTKEDSDEDGRTDGWEVENEYDPLIPNTDFPEEEIPAPDYVEAESDGEVFITELDNDYFVNEDTPGYIGVNPIDVELEEGHSANISIEYDPSKTEGETPTLYRFNQETQRYEEVDSTVSGNKVSANITEGGVYVLLNHRLVEDVWHNDIFRPDEDNADGTIDMVFSIDFSGSMDDNDPNDIRLLVTKEFIAKLRDTDRAAIVTFSDSAEIIAPLNTNKQELNDTIDNISGSGSGCGGTNCTDGIRKALDALADSTAKYKYIVFLTDGEDSGFKNNLDSLAAEAKQKNIVIHTVGLVGSGGVDVESLQSIADKTHGRYFLATVGEEPENNPELIEIYDQIESITIDRQRDTNDDRISDYYTRLICEGKLGTHSGIQDLFGGASYEEVQDNNDLDGDGILNGDELVIEATDTGVFVKVVSLPYLADSDGDGLNDKDETDHTTSPVRKNSYANISDIEFLTDSDNFKSHEYLTKYNKDVLTRGAVAVGNAFFGSTFDQTILYRQVLLEYFDDLRNRALPTAENTAQYDTYDAWFEAQDAAIKARVDEEAKANNPSGLESLLDGISKFYNGLSDHWDIGTATLEGTAAMNKFVKGAEELTDIYKNITKFEVKAYKNIISGMTKSLKTLSRNGHPTLAKNLGFVQDGFKTLSKNGGLGNTIEIVVESKTFQNVSKFADKYGPVVDSFFWVVDTGINIVEACRDFGTILGSFKTIEDNLYILDCISGNSTNLYLRCAASDIRYYIYEFYEENGSTFSLTLDQTNAVASTAFLDGLHIVIGLIGPGKYIELARTIGNFFFDLDEKAEGAAKTIALSATAEILAENFEDHLNAGYATEMGNLWVSFTSYSEEFYMCILNLAELRQQAEEQYMKWKKKVTDDCEANIAKSKALAETYTEHYFYFIKI